MKNSKKYWCYKHKNDGEKFESERVRNEPKADGNRTTWIYYHMKIVFFQIREKQLDVIEKRTENNWYISTNSLMSKHWHWFICATNL